MKIMNSSKCKSSTKLVPFLLLLALMQLLVIMQIHDVSTIDTHRDVENSLQIVPTNPSITSVGGSMMSTTHLSTTKLSSDVLYPCFPSRIHTQNLQQRQDYKYNNITTTKTTIIYLETAFVDLHYETYYSFIHEICSCENSSSSKGSHWTIDTNTIPIFYIGPTDYLTVGFERVLQEYNTTTCGPIYFGTPPKNKEPDLTIVTTSYPNDFYDDSTSTITKVNEGDGKYRHLLNNPKYIFICHEDAPFLEGEDATNVYFLTPLHNRYVVPSYFPPSIVQRHERIQHERQQQHHSSIEKRRKKLKNPIFLVLGSFDKKYRRNVASLEYPLRYYRNYIFTIRFMGGASSSGWPSAAKLTQQIRDRFPNDYHKIELLIRKDTDEFMDLVGEADVILPLVDGSNFYHYGNGYQGGKKLTSSVMWGLGMHKKMIIYRPLADVFGIQEDNTTYFLHGDSTVQLAAFHEAFGRCLKHLLGESM